MFTVINGIIFDSLIVFPFSILLIRLIELIVEKFSLSTYNYFAGLFSPTIDDIIIYQILYDTKKAIT
jgi:hypothetical protein